MAAGKWTFTNTGLTSLQSVTFNLDVDVFKMALFLSASNIGPSSTTYAGLTNEHANANGYTTGGVAATLTMSGTNPMSVDCTDAVWNASGGSIVARYAVIYEVGGNVLCYCLCDTTPADVTAVNGTPFTVQIHANGLYTAAAA